MTSSTELRRRPKGDQLKTETDSPRAKVLVTGAGGFIGHHLVKFLKSKGLWVRGVDIKKPEYEPTAADEFLVLDLRVPENAQKSVQGVRDVYQLAADMGGIGRSTAAGGPRGGAGRGHPPRSAEKSRRRRRARRSRSGGTASRRAVSATLGTASRGCPGSWTPTTGSRSTWERSIS